MANLMGDNNVKTIIRLSFSAWIILISLFILKGSPEALKFVGLNIGNLFEKDSGSASVDQYRTNVVAANNGLSRPPTQAEVTFEYPTKMRVDSTKPASLVTILKEEILEFDEKGTGFTPSLRAVKELAGDISIELKSSGFDIEGIESAKVGDLYPVRFNWTLHPKNEGDHIVLLNLEPIIRDARLDSQLIGKTKVSINNADASLSDGGTLVLPIEVVGKWGVSSKYTDTVGWIFAFCGFLLAWEPITNYISSMKKKEVQQQNRQKKRRGQI